MVISIYQRFSFIIIYRMVLHRSYAKELKTLHQHKMSQTQSQHRLFIAIKIPDKVKDEILTVCHSIHKARWIKRDNIHLTLKFIGGVNTETFLKTKDILSKITSPPLYLHLKDIGYFGRGQRAHVLWLGINSDKRLLSLRNHIENKLADADIAPKEKRPFSPHITLSRFKDMPVKKIQSYLEKHKDFEIKPFLVNSFHLFSSFLTPKGAIYTVEQSYQLIE